MPTIGFMSSEVTGEQQVPSHRAHALMHRLHAAEREGRLVAEWLAIYGEMADYWALKKSLAPPPPLPDPDAAEDEPHEAIADTNPRSK